MFSKVNFTLPSPAMISLLVLAIFILKFVFFSVSDGDLHPNSSIVSNFYFLILLVFKTGSLDCTIEFFGLHHRILWTALINIVNNFLFPVRTAQLIMCLIGEQKVRGSNPITQSQSKTPITTSMHCKFNSFTVFLRQEPTWFLYHSEC